VHDWKTRVICSAAHGFYRITIKRHPTEVCWSWALEWNKNYRIIGLFGEDGPVDRVLRALPEIEFTPLSDEGDQKVGMRVEAPYDEENDLLFDCVEDGSV